MADFSTGLQMGMGLARDVRSANMAAADRKEQKEYRDMRTKALKKQMRRGKKADDRADKELDLKTNADNRAKALHKERMDAMKRAANPMVNDYDNKRGLLERHDETVNAVVTRHTARMGNLNKAVIAAQELKLPSLPNLLAMQKRENEKHNQFLFGLEQSFMSASNRPFQGTVSVAPYVDGYGQQHYGVKLDGASMEEAKAFHKEMSGMVSKRPPMGGGLPVFGKPTGTPDAKQPAASGAAQQLTDPNIDKFLQ